MPKVAWSSKGRLMVVIAASSAKGVAVITSRRFLWRMACERMPLARASGTVNAVKVYPQLRQIVTQQTGARETPFGNASSVAGMRVRHFIQYSAQVYIVAPE
jgi:hypothetical protein